MCAYRCCVSTYHYPAQLTNTDAWECCSYFLFHRAFVIICCSDLYIVIYTEAVPLRQVQHCLRCQCYPKPGMWLISLINMIDNSKLNCHILRRKLTLTESEQNNCSRLPEKWTKIIPNLCHITWICEFI